MREIGVGRAADVVDGERRPIARGDVRIARREICGAQATIHAGRVPTTGAARWRLQGTRALMARMATFDMAELRRLDEAFHLHPFTNHRAMHRDGSHVVRSANGSTVIDETGRELLDGLSGLWCVNVGYGRQEIVDAATAQMQAVAFYPSFFNTTTEPAIPPPPPPPTPPPQPPQPPPSP